MSTTKSLRTNMNISGDTVDLSLLPLGIAQRQAKWCLPSIFIAHDPQIPSLQLLLKERVGSISSLILIRASKNIGPHFLGSI
jgi:hypothetical protein